MVLPMICHYKKTNSEDNNGDFRERCSRVRLENGSEFLLTSALVSYVTSDTEHHFHFRAVWHGFRIYEDTKWNNIS